MYYLQFKQRYAKLNGNLVTPLLAKKGCRSASNMTALLRELESSDDDDSSDDAGPSTTQNNLTKPWLREFHKYLNTTDELSDGQTLVQWWGVSTLSHWQHLNRTQHMVRTS
jgi:hypothetical protein